MIADAILRQSGDGVVERVDAQCRPFPVLREIVGGKRDIVHVGQERIVDLHHQPGVDDRLVFFAQRLGELEQELFVVLVIFVPVARNGARRRHHRQEGVGDRRAFQRGLEDRDVLLQRGVALIGDRADANDGAAFRQFLRRKIIRVEFRK